MSNTTKCSLCGWTYFNNRFILDGNGRLQKCRHCAGTAAIDFYPVCLGSRHRCPVPWEMFTPILTQRYCNACTNRGPPPILPDGARSDSAPYTVHWKSGYPIGIHDAEPLHNPLSTPDHARSSAAGPSSLRPRPNPDQQLFESLLPLQHADPQHPETRDQLKSLLTNWLLYSRPEHKGPNPGQCVNCLAPIARALGKAFCALCCNGSIPSSYENFTICRFCNRLRWTAEFEISKTAGTPPETCDECLVRRGDN
ncbi:hypothetical protein GGS24DRAFT_500397 [Hypoxylon argillaceum]|nr:hypothetical protein GGS24DRAFT_500397 [Hypoxylon argillaceum]